MKNNKHATMWAVVNPDGKVMARTAAMSKTEVVDKVYNDMGLNWNRLRDERGFKIVRVALVPIDHDGPPPPLVTALEAEAGAKA